MSESCNHDCEHCSQSGHCETKIEKLVPNEVSSFKHTIGIVSGKGGVGKSFVTSMLAVELARQGYKVGILDGDVTGPSIPKAFNIHEQANSDGERFIFPALSQKLKIKIISSNMLLEDETQPIIWRGVLISGLLRQFYTDVLWEELDYLLIDMPPGTADVTLTAFQSIPLDGIVVVTSPQDLVNVIVSKAVNMAKQMNVNILGVVENMSYVECPNCNEKISIYGESKIEKVAKDYELKLLGQIPIRVGVSKMIDDGKIEEVEIDEVKKVVKNIL